MNVVVLTGRLTSDPTIREGEKTKMASFRLAVQRPFDKEKADFIQCKAFGKSAEYLENYKSKGDEIAVSGRIQAESYPRRDGTTGHNTEVICDRVESTYGSKGGERAEANHHESEESEEERPSAPQEELPDTFEQAEDDIPF